MKATPAIKNKHQKLRFGAVGILNTLVDFGIYSVLSYVVGWPAIVANFISTSAGFIVSFFLNRRFTFDSQSQKKLHEFARFLITTLIGLWLIQPAIIYYVKSLLALVGIGSIWAVVVPKAAAILVGLVWNYLWYSRYVFVAKQPSLRALWTPVRAYVSRFIRSDFGIALFISVAWQAVMTTIGNLIQFGIVNITSGSLLQHTGSWDGGWFQSIATNFYHGSPAAPAFYPLFPFTARLVQTLLLNQVSLLVAGLLLNTVCLWLGVVALIKIARLLYGNGLSYVTWTVLLFLAMPAAFFLHQFYSEAIFIAFGFWAYYFALTRRWRWAAICLLFLTAARVTSILFIVLAGLEFWRSHQWNLKKTFTDRQILWFGLAPLGFLAYGLYLKLTRGDFLAMFHAYHTTNDWVYEQFNPKIWQILLSALHATGHCVRLHFVQCDAGSSFVNLMLPFVLLVILGVLSVAAILWLRGLYIPLGLMGLASCVMLTLNNNLVSVHRYVLPVVTTYLVSIELMRRLKLPLWLLFPFVQLGLAVQVLLFFLFINGHFAG